jgi:hypothetical protein
MIYPYYTVNKNQDTLISVTNASDVGKAIQVRFREGMNGRDALSFVLFVAAHDTWTAALSAIEDEGVLMTTGDRSCTLSPVPSEGISFRTAAFDGTGVTPADGGPTGPQRTREGFFEMIVGGDVRPGSTTAAAITPRPNLYPPTCTIDEDTFPNDLEKPTGGVYGTATIVDVTSGTFYGYNADALAGVADAVLFQPGYPYPGPELRNVVNEGAGGTTRAHVTTADGHELTLDYASAIDAVSAVFMADAIYNDYLVSPSLGAATDWIVTFPTKQFYVDSLYGTVPKAPFDNAFVDGTATTEVSGTVYDREGLSFEFGTGCGQASCASAGLFYQVNAISTPTATDPPTPIFESSVLGSQLFDMILPTLGDAGYAQLRLSSVDDTRVLPGGIDAQTGHEVWLHGLPVTGFMVYNVVNANASPGVLANYSGAFPHRRTIASESLF